MATSQGEGKLNFKSVEDLERDRLCKAIPAQNTKHE